jgi:hypothetical protein
MREGNCTSGIGFKLNTQPSETPSSKVQQHTITTPHDTPILALRPKSNYSYTLSTPSHTMHPPGTALHLPPTPFRTGANHQHCHANDTNGINVPSQRSPNASGRVCFTPPSYGRGDKCLQAGVSDIGACFQTRWLALCEARWIGTAWLCLVWGRGLGR